jgi:hypothetical protein
MDNVENTPVDFSTKEMFRKSLLQNVFLLLLYINGRNVPHYTPLQRQLTDQTADILELLILSRMYQIVYPTQMTLYEHRFM